MVNESLTPERYGTAMKRVPAFTFVRLGIAAGAGSFATVDDSGVAFLRDEQGRNRFNKFVEASD